MNKSMLKRSLAAVVLVVLSAQSWGQGLDEQSAITHHPSPITHQYHVAACDWMMLKRQKIGEFQVARSIVLTP